MFYVIIYVYFIMVNTDGSFKKNTFKTKTKVLHLFTRNLKVHDCYFVYINTRKLLLWFIDSKEKISTSNHGGKPIL